MSQFWSADDSMKVGETKVSIPSENGLDYSPGQKVQIFVDPSTKFMDGRETYLEFNLKLSLPAGKYPTRLQLDKCSSTLIRNIRIYDGSRGNLLEEISNYDSYVSVKYDYDKDSNIDNIRALREACLVKTTDNRGTLGTTQTPMANTTTNPYFVKTSGNQTTTFSDTDFLTAKVCMPLHTGIFAGSKTIFPLMLTSGLYMELDLNSADDIVKQLDSVMRDRRTPLNPVFHSLNGSSTPNVWVQNASSTSFYVDVDNNLDGPDRVSRFPFVVGESFNFCESLNNGVASTTTNLSGLPLVISEINLSNGANASNGLIEIVTTKLNKLTSNASITDSWCMYSTAVSRETAYDVSFVMSNVNLIVSQVHLDPDYEAGMLQKVREGRAIEFDIDTLTNYKHSILASDRQTTMQIFANNSRAQSLMVVPQDSSVYTSAQKISATGTYVIKGTDNTNSSLATKNEQDVCLASNRSAYSGICDELSSVQYVIDGQRVPSREISTRKIATKNSIDAFHLYEIEKMLDSAGIPPKSFSAFMDNFIFGRSFSAGGQNGAMDLRGRDLAVVLRYQTLIAPDKGKLFNSYIFHLRRLIVRDSGVEVVF
tara:strand:+ start:1 stop:1785 length:1785 start_codon:yes stop_codon:yes gene_type:complete